MQYTLKKTHTKNISSDIYKIQKSLVFVIQKIKEELIFSIWIDASLGKDPDKSRYTNSSIILMQKGPLK